ncbi:MAG: hypothetical protein IPM24_12725 [Bryobacterales bacterium]|nr:hypothetical protein [Bryobacterales bacterium]
MLGVVSSLVASTVVTVGFALIAEHDFANFVAGAASRRAVDEVLKLLSGVPVAVYEGSDLPDPHFEEKFAAAFDTSSFLLLFQRNGGLLRYSTRHTV